MSNMSDYTSLTTPAISIGFDKVGTDKVKTLIDLFDLESDSWSFSNVKIKDNFRRILNDLINDSSDRDWSKELNSVATNLDEISDFNYYLSYMCLEHLMTTHDALNGSDFGKIHNQVYTEFLILHVIYSGIFKNIHSKFNENENTIDFSDSYDSFDNYLVERIQYHKDKIINQIKTGIISPIRTLFLFVTDISESEIQKLFKISTNKYVCSSLVWIAGYKGFKIEQKSVIETKAYEFGNLFKKEIDEYHLMGSAIEPNDHDVLTSDEVYLVLDVERQNQHIEHSHLIEKCYEKEQDPKKKDILKNKLINSKETSCKWYNYYCITFHPWYILNKFYWFKFAFPFYSKPIIESIGKTYHDLIHFNFEYPVFGGELEYIGPLTHEVVESEVQNMMDAGYKNFGVTYKNMQPYYLNCHSYDIMYHKFGGVGLLKSTIRKNGTNYDLLWWSTYQYNKEKTKRIREYSCVLSKFKCEYNPETRKATYTVENVGPITTGETMDDAFDAQPDMIKKLVDSLEFNLFF
uniref:Uncharacterized protein n=1 Tax=viral metagenome TaxID=1070528 RepID=A0A6C0ACR3_9ZZZZ